MTTYRIGEAARLTGLSSHAIRFYDGRGLLPGTLRTESGYRMYTERDLRRLRLVRNLRDLGVPLAETARVADEAFGSECGHYARQLSAVLDRQQEVVRRRMQELQALAADLKLLRVEAEAVASRTQDGGRVDECPNCLLIDQGAIGAACCPPVSQQSQRGTRRMNATDELLDVLQCDIAARPADAPTPDQLRTDLLAVHEDPGTLTLTFRANASAAVGRLAEAERSCCGGLDFRVTERPDAVELDVRGTPLQVQAFALLWR